MRALVLYARSRQVPASVAVAALLCLVVRAVAPSADLQWPALAVTGAVSALAVGLSGQDDDLDRTAAWRWPVYRVAHVLVIAVVAAVLVIGTAPLPFVVRASAGMTGLAALAAGLFGGHLGWTLPCAWFAVAFFGDSWLFAPPDSSAAAVTAAAIGVLGLMSYVLLHSQSRLRGFGTVR